MGTVQTMQMVVPCGVIHNCQCTWGSAEGLDEDMQALDMAANIMGEDVGEWSELDDTHEVHSVHGESTEK